MRFWLLVAAASLPGVIVGIGIYILSRRMAQTWVRRALRSIGLAAAVSPFGVYLGPEAEVFFPSPASAVIVVSVIATIWGKGEALARYIFGSILAIVLASIAVFAVSSAWGAFGESKRPRLYRTGLAVVVVFFLIFYFVAFEVYRAQANYSFYPVGNDGWEVRAFAVAIAQQRGRLAYRRYVSDHEYDLRLWMRWVGHGSTPVVPRLVSAELIMGNARTPLAVVRDQQTAPQEWHDGRVSVARHIELADPDCADDDRPSVTIGWRHRQVEVRLSYESESTQTLSIPLKRIEQLVPRYAPLFAFAMPHPFRRMWSSGSETEPASTPFPAVEVRTVRVLGQLNPDR